MPIDYDNYAINPLNDVVSTDTYHFVRISGSGSTQSADTFLIQEFRTVQASFKNLEQHKPV